MELLSVIRRWHYRDHFSIQEISRRTGLSRNTVRKYLRSDSIEPKFHLPDRPSGLDPYADKLSHMLRQEAGKSRKQKRTIKQLHADLAALGYDGSYNRVAAFARDWKDARQREQKTAGRGRLRALPSLEQALRANQRHHHDEPKLRRMGDRVRRSQDDDGAARPASPIAATSSKPEMIASASKTARRGPLNPPRRNRET